ncbi:periplasmic heavy metal sensor [Novosphingobium pentaromativorans]|uniref:periplasmic heavy metal sensor n=1 Tax=Novosphingobium pentaromativorans TaxID=205844 RepID=UPI0002E907E7|nr:periplasmic heavy metal sensor [Novosphingobium pentaromativorans]AIT82329.1 heavy metal resistance protein [Novosphingobium pentaromativorans US6-1]
MGSLRRYFLAFVLAFLAALAALLLGQKLRAGDNHESRLHAVLHEELDLDPGQEAQIDRIEHDFAERRKLLDGRLRQANAQLAQAMEREHAYGPAVEKAVDQSHMAMGELQKATLQHVFAMRSVLRPDQARRFDAAVAHALTAPPEE